MRLAFHYRDRASQDDPFLVVLLELTIEQPSSVLWPSTCTDLLDYTLRQFEDGMELRLGLDDGVDAQMRTGQVYISRCRLISEEYAKILWEHGKQLKIGPPPQGPTLEIDSS